MMNSKYKKPDWAISQTTRESGLVEDVCKHGVGHPNREWMEEHDPDGKKRFGVHGCCSCCSERKTQKGES